jgi:hypothetical protein
MLVLSTLGLGNDDPKVLCMMQQLATEDDEDASWPWPFDSGFDRGTEEIADI